MAILTKQLDISHVWEAPTSERQRDLFQVWDRANGIMCREILQFYKHLVMFGIPLDNVVPKITYMGSDSLAKRVMGSGWRSELAKHTGKDDTAAAYIAAAKGKPILEYVCFISLGGTDRLTYERMILPFKTQKGWPQLVTLSTLIHLDQHLLNAPDHLTSQKNQNLKYSPANSQVLLGSAVDPNLERSVFAASTQ